jgi:hypothetical protein
VAVFAVLVSIGFLGVSWLDWSMHSECPLGLQFERSSAEIVSERSFPPMVECRYLYESGLDGRELYPPETVRSDTLPAFVTVAACLGCLSAAVVADKRTRPTKGPMLRSDPGAR